MSDEKRGYAKAFRAKRVREHRARARWFQRNEGARRLRLFAWEASAAAKLDADEFNDEDSEKSSLT
jgi:hypothetical protein